MRRAYALMRPAKVAVIGAAGQVGSTLVHHFHNQGVNVVAAVRNTLSAALVHASTPGCDIRVGSLTPDPRRVHLLDIGFDRMFGLQRKQDRTSRACRMHRVRQSARDNHLERPVGLAAMDLSQAGMIETGRNGEVLGMIALDRRDHLVDEERVGVRKIGDTAWWQTESFRGNVACPAGSTVPEECLAQK